MYTLDNKNKDFRGKPNRKSYIYIILVLSSFYFSTLDIKATLSTCTVCGNISTG